MAHPDVPAEQAHVDHATARLQQMRDTATRMLRDAFGERGGTFQALTERDIRVRTSLSRLEQLQIGVEALVFGRIDRIEQPLSGAPRTGRPSAALHDTGDRADTDHDTDTDGDDEGGDGDPDVPQDSGATGVGIDGSEAFHIGRLAVSDVDQEPLVVDWRAPIAEPFYRATGAHPMHLRRRRHFLTEGQRIVDLEDEYFGGVGDEGAGLGLSGSQVLLSALSRSRTGRMRDIVATVQREQDEIIRGPLGGILVVQGGPGTGKTAVALHRAAYLLYTHRFPLERQGVLVVGPNPTFLRYIEYVLPSLGESGVELSTVSGLFGPLHVSGRAGHDDSDTTRLKGDPRMVRFLARAAGDRQRPLRRAVQIPYGRAFLRLTPHATEQIVAAAKRRPGPHNTRRRLVENLLWRHLLTEVERRAPAPETDPDQLRLEVTADDGSTEIIELQPGGTEALTAADVGRTLRRVPEVVEALDRMWPLLTPQSFLHDLFGARPLLALAGKGILGAPDIDLLHRAREASLDEIAWSDADIPLLDEARALLGPVRRSTTPGETDIRTFGHVVVDEAQDLSPMQLRMLARRSLSGSMTVVGDIAQATGGWAPSSWNQVVDHLPARRGWRLAELTVNYRTPSEIMDVASVILEQFAPGMRAPEAVRSVGEGPEIVQVSSGGPFPSSGLPEEVARVVEAELLRVAGDDQSGTVGVVAPQSLVRPVADALERAGLPFGLAAQGALDFPVALLGITDAKGLEFDSVVVVEPSRLTDESQQGLRALYVAVTRATQRLVVVHAEALPDSLGAAMESSA
jgi:DNA helicase IV